MEEDRAEAFNMMNGARKPKHESCDFEGPQPSSFSSSSEPGTNGANAKTMGDMMLIRFLERTTQHERPTAKADTANNSLVVSATVSSPTESSLRMAATTDDQVFCTENPGTDDAVWFSEPSMVSATDTKQLQGPQTDGEDKDVAPTAYGLGSEEEKSPFSVSPVVREENPQEHLRSSRPHSPPSFTGAPRTEAAGRREEARVSIRPNRLHPCSHRFHQRHSMYENDLRLRCSGGKPTTATHFGMTSRICRDTACPSLATSSPKADPKHEAHNSLMETTPIGHSSLNRSKGKEEEAAFWDSGTNLGGDKAAPRRRWNETAYLLQQPSNSGDDDRIRLTEEPPVQKRRKVPQPSLLWSLLTSTTAIPLRDEQLEKGCRVRCPPAASAALEEARRRGQHPREQRPRLEQLQQENLKHPREQRPRLEQLEQENRLLKQEFRRLAAGSISGPIAPTGRVPTSFHEQQQTADQLPLSASSVPYRNLILYHQQENEELRRMLLRWRQEEDRDEAAAETVRVLSDRDHLDNQAALRGTIVVGDFHLDDERQMDALVNVVAPDECVSATLEMERIKRRIMCLKQTFLQTSEERDAILHKNADMQENLHMLGDEVRHLKVQNEELKLRLKALRREQQGDRSGHHKWETLLRQLEEVMKEKQILEHRYKEALSTNEALTREVTMRYGYKGNFDYSDNAAGGTSS